MAEHPTRRKTVRSNIPSETTQSRFDLRDQAAQTINNVGGNQNIFLPGKSLVLPSGASEALTPAERVAAAAGLLMFWGGVAFLGFAVRATVENILDANRAGTLHSPYTDYAGGHWKLALALMFVGVVLPRLGLRLFGHSAGAG
jgi:hypothetical protein